MDFQTFVSSFCQMYIYTDIYFLYHLNYSYKNIVLF